MRKFLFAVYALGLLFYVLAFVLYFISERIEWMPGFDFSIVSIFYLFCFFTLLSVISSVVYFILHFMGRHVWPEIIVSIISILLHLTFLFYLRYFTFWGLLWD